MAAAANDPGERGGSRAARWLLAPPSCGDQLPARVPRAAPRRSSLRLPLSLPGSFASLTMTTRTDLGAALQPAQQDHGDTHRDRRVRDVEGGPVEPAPVEVEEVDHLAVAQPADQVPEGASQDG